MYTASTVAPGPVGADRGTRVRGLADAQDANGVRDHPRSPVIAAIRRICQALAPIDAWREPPGLRRPDAFRAGTARLRALARGGKPVVDWLGSDDGASVAPRVPPGSLVREGCLVRLRAHVPANRAAFQRWYADEEIVRLLRHDQRTLSDEQARSYFDSIILPLTARGLSYAIHEAATDDLIGTTALTDLVSDDRSAHFRIVIGEKDRWGRGYGTEATELVAWEAFTRHGRDRIRLEVFHHNERASRVYRRVGFEVTGMHVEWVGSTFFELHVVEMKLERDVFFARQAQAAGGVRIDDAGDSVR
jgi:RimJ/RimL family protein N-acetyltransferase